MSVKEKVTQLLAQQEALKEQSLLEKARREEAYWHRYKSELPQVRERQKALFDQLRRKGVVATLEEAFDQHITFPVLPDSRVPDLPEKPFIWPSAEEIMEAMRWKPWEIKMPFPTLNPLLGDNSEWEESLRILALEKAEGLGYPNTTGRLITITYTDQKKLTIAGERETFSSPLPKPKAQRVDLIETALAQAIINPGQDPSLRHRLIRPNLGISTYPPFRF